MCPLPHEESPLSSAPHTWCPQAWSPEALLGHSGRGARGAALSARCFPLMLGGSKLFVCGKWVVIMVIRGDGKAQCGRRSASTPGAGSGQAPSWAPAGTDPRKAPVGGAWLPRVQNEGDLSQVGRKAVNMSYGGRGDRAE